jgi:pimeloyl-ACP methyl ester carboxylesterase
MTQARDGGPALPLYWSEIARASAGWGFFLASLPLSPTLPAGDGHPVLVLPGLLAGDGSTVALRCLLRGLGYDVSGWELGRNLGPTAEAVSGMDGRLEELVQRHGHRVSLVGWSLGGIFARTLVRRSPELVRQVVTLGSPFRLARSDQSRATRVFERFSHLHVEHLSLPLEDGAEPLPVPTTSVYSRYDGIVAWRACLDAPGPFAENVEVYGSHLGLGHNPAVIWAVTDRLAQPEGAWRPFRAPAALRPFFPRPGTPTADARPDPGTPDPLTGSAA